ncbi:hypothetical protein B0A55_07387 [Friedmanniomyces simplex]|uniref:Uncharacterized protein n=1 Tax=Friedmanniomyces simplex TaxID=329884 RepID=A0A4U0X3M1_9PEZI|nr:hypothetical protein B0A55_07387 [Friedmanniomyces simplex]
MSVSGWSIESAQADFGIGGNNKKRAPADSIDFKLTDWNGEWAPAPLNWDALPAFTDPTKAASIERWLREMICDVRPVSADKLSSTGELAPRYWVPTPVRNQAPTALFQELMAVDKPAPVDADDLVGVKLWWELYQSSSASTLQPYSHPFIAGIDKDETLEERLARENDYGADKHVENKKRTEMAKKAAKREQQSKTKRLAKAKSDTIATGAFVGNRIKPGLNLYVRSARPDDMVQVRDIYNYHVDFTCCAPETQRLTISDMQARYNSVIDSGLPH